MFTEQDDLVRDYVDNGIASAVCDSPEEAIDSYNAAYELKPAYDIISHIIYRHLDQEERSKAQKCVLGTKKFLMHYYLISQKLYKKLSARRKRQDIMDIVQESLIGLLNGIDNVEFNTERQLLAYFAGIVKNKFIDYISYKTPNAYPYPDRENEKLIEIIFDKDALEPEELLLKEEFLDELLKAITCLNESQTEVFLLRYPDYADFLNKGRDSPDLERVTQIITKYPEGLTYNDIAKELGLNLDTVKTRLARAIGKLRNSLTLKED